MNPNDIRSLDSMIAAAVRRELDPLFARLRTFEAPVPYDSPVREVMSSQAIGLTDEWKPLGAVQMRGLRAGFVVFIESIPVAGTDAVYELQFELEAGNRSGFLMANHATAAPAANPDIAPIRRGIYRAVLQCPKNVDVPEGNKYCFVPSQEFWPSALLADSIRVWARDSANSGGKTTITVLGR
jgi:hypothetical protein